MLEQSPAPATTEDVENTNLLFSDPIVEEPLSAPVDTEEGKSTIPLSSLAYNNVIDCPPSLYIHTIDSSPNPAKSANDSLDLILIQSRESSPAIVANKENFEPKPKVQNNEEDDIVKSLKKIICNLKAKSARDISLAKKVTRRDIVDKMSANHKLSLSKERKNNLKLLRETREIYEKRLRDVEQFYAEKVAFLEENRTIAFDGLLETKSTLEEQAKKTNESINSIINIISLYPSNVATSLPISKATIEKRLSATRTSQSFENESKYSDKVAEIERLETEVYEQKLRITCLENKIKDEITSKGQVQQKLTYTEILYRTSIREKEELLKNLQEELTNLKNSKTEMENRHKEQFIKYDRMLKRAESEIAVQKREVLALRTQFVPGTPTTYLMKPMGTPSMIKESTPSSSKLNLTSSLLESASKKATQRSESTPSFGTAPSVQSSASEVFSLNQTPSSKASKSKAVRFRKAPSENSDLNSNSSAAFCNSDDSGEPKPKSARILRTRRMRAAKSKKGL